MLDPIANTFAAAPVLGKVGLQEMIALVFVLVSVISYIVRTVQGNNQRMPPPVQRPGRRRDERANDEIENFLQNVSRSSEVKRPAEAARQQEGRPRPPGNRQQVPTSQKPGTKSAPPSEGESAARRGRSEIGSRTVASSDLGGGLKQHLREAMGERVVKEAQRDVGQGVSESVQRHLGSSGRPTAPAESQRVATSELFTEVTSKSAEECCKANRAESLKKMLRSPDSMRQAIIIQEVLNRPKCLR